MYVRKIKTKKCLRTSVGVGLENCRYLRETPTSILAKQMEDVVAPELIPAFIAQKVRGLLLDLTRIALWVGLG